MQAKIVYAGSNNTSYEQAEADLRELAELRVGSKQVRRVCKQIGSERCAERDAEAAAYQAKPLMERKSVPPGVTAPDVAVVGADGGRLQIFERSATDAAASTDAAEAASDESDERDEVGKHWREDKIGLLMTMTSDEHESDPCPEIPQNFVDPLRIVKLAREFKRHVPATEEAVKEAADPDAEQEAYEDPQWEPPKVTAKHLVASRRVWGMFGPLVATAAWLAGFYGAKRRAFLGDGAGNNWTLWRNYFSSFTPILDFIHALTYVFAAAMAGRGFAEGWECYVRWIGWVWQGRLEEVLAALTARLSELGEPSADEPANSPRQIVARSLEYLRNNQERMKYAEYRKHGLPITTAYVESAVKQFNYRVKGTEKFWNEQGAEEMLQLRADHLSDIQPLTAFWKAREASESGQNRYRQAA